TSRAVCAGGMSTEKKKEARKKPGDGIDWWREERAARERGFEVIAGIDEAGRGPLAGPVVAAAVILPFGREMPGVRDSKTLSAEQRSRAYETIFECALGIGVGVADVATIDS